MSTHSGGDVSDPLEVLGADLVRHDDKDRQRGEDSTERALLEQAKSDFVATVSHELRSPLAVIMGFASLLKQTACDPSRHEETLHATDVIQERGAYMQSLIDSLLELARIQSGDFALSLDNVDLSELVRNATREIVATPRHSIDVEISPDLGAAMCDPKRLAVAITNLASNAVKFSPDGGTIQVTARKKDDRALVEVSDDGIGISAADQEHIFDRFTQADTSSTRRFAGTGMGLYIARQIVEAHGGTLSVRSGLGQGCTFTIDVPLRQSCLPSGHNAQEAA